MSIFRKFASSFAGGFIAVAGVAFAQDFDREARWRSEVEPSLIVGDAVDLAVNGRKVFAIFTEGKSKTVAVIVVHGVGVHPDHGWISKLRTQVADGGFSTLSVQMPVLPKEETDPSKYRAVFSHSNQRIAAAAAWLKQKGYDKLVIASHSMGAWMTNVYFEETPNPPIHAWASIGITGRIGSTGNFNGPILDLTGENDIPPVRGAAWLRKLKLLVHSGSETVVIPGANHFYEGKEQAAGDAVVAFVARVTK
jgi:pimeloyl-ACP methyl ester carboxylesterase